MPESSYRNAIRANVRALWLGLYTLEDFYEGMDGALFQIRRAFIEGARQCGIAPAEFTPEERAAIQRAIQSERGFIWQFGLSIEAGSKASGGKLGPHFQRAEAWILRYRDVANKARIMTCGNQKLMWELGATKEHCGTCARLHRKVKRATTWQDAGVQPQNPPNPLLECQGWKCGCTLTPTEAPMSRGPLPKVP